MSTSAFQVAWLECSFHRSKPKFIVILLCPPANSSQGGGRMRKINDSAINVKFFYYLVLNLNDRRSVAELIDYSCFIYLKDNNNNKGSSFLWIVSISSFITST